MIDHGRSNYATPATITHRAVKIIASAVFVDLVSRGPVSAREARAKVRTDKALAERGKSGESRQALLDLILPVLADPGIPDEQVACVPRNSGVIENENCT